MIDKGSNVISQSIFRLLVSTLTINHPLLSSASAEHNSVSTNS